MRPLRRTPGLALVLCLLAFGLVAHAQEGFVYRVTGEVVLTLDGAERALHVYAVDIPENVAEGVENPDVRARLEKSAGTTEHGATWVVPEPVLMGGIVLSSPTSMAVNVAARPTEDRDAGLGELHLYFELDLATLNLHGEVPASVWFSPETLSSRDFYALTDGTFEVTLVEQVDDVTLRVQGSFAGLLSFQARLSGIAHNPDDTIAVTGRFDLRQVVGTQQLAEVRTGE